MADLGNLYFTVGLTDKTDEDIKKIKEKLNRELKIDVAVEGTKSLAEVEKKAKAVADALERIKAAGGVGKAATPIDAIGTAAKTSVADINALIASLGKVDNELRRVASQEGNFEGLQTKKLLQQQKDLRSQLSSLEGGDKALGKYDRKKELQESTKATIEFTTALAKASKEYDTMMAKGAVASNQRIKELEQQRIAQEKLQSKQMTGRMVEQANGIGVRSNEIEQMRKYYSEIEKQQQIREKSLATLRDTLGKITAMENKLLRSVDSKNRGSDFGNVITKLRNMRAAISAEMAKGGNLQVVSQKSIQDVKTMTTAVNDLVDAERRRQAQERNSRTEELARKHRVAANSVRYHAQNQDFLNLAINKTNKGMIQQSRMLTDLRSQAMGFFSIYAAERFLHNLILINGEFEKQKLALAAMLNDTPKANEMFSQLKSLAVKSPFQFQDLTNFAKQLTAYSIPVGELYDTTKRLADISAGLGVDMSRIVLAYGQIRAASVLRGQEVRQLTEAGIPIINELSNRFSELEGRAISAADVFDRISKRQVSFQVVKDVLFDMTDEGGKFFQMQEVLAQSLSGKFSNLKDAYQIMMDEIGQSQSKFLKSSIDATTELMKNWEAIAAAMVAIAAGSVARKASMVFGAGVSESTSGLGQDLSALRQAKIKKTAYLMEKKALEGLTIIEAKRLAMGNALTKADMARLIRDGKLTKSTLLRAVATRDLTVAEGKLAASLLGVDVALVKQARTANTLYMLAITRITSAIQKLGLAMKTAFLSPTTWLMAIAAAIGWIGTKFAAENAKMKRSIDSVSESAINGIEEIGRKLASLEGVDLKISTDKQINGKNNELLEDLKRYSPDYGLISQEASEIQDLAKRYEFLKTKLDETRAAYIELEKAKGVLAAVEKKGLFGFMSKNMEDVIKGFDKTEKKAAEAAMAVGKYNSVIREGVKKQMSAEEYSQYEDLKLPDFLNKLRDNNRLAIIYSEDASSALKLSAGAVQDYFVATNKQANYLESEIVPKLKVFAKDVNDAFIGLGIDTDETTRKLFIEEMLKLVDASENVKNKFREVASIEFDFRPNYVELPPEKVASEYADRLRAAIKEEGSRLGTDLNLEGLINFDGISGAITMISELERAIETLNGEVEAGRRILFPTPEQAKSLADYVTLLGWAKNVEKEMVMPAPAKGGSDKDPVAEKARKQMELWSAAMDTYKKYETLVGKDAALGKVRNDPRFSGMDFNPEGYRAALESILSTLDISKEKQKEVSDSINKMFTDSIDFDAADKQVKQFLEILSRSIKDASDRWNIFDQIFKASGDQEMSYRVAFGVDSSGMGGMKNLTDFMKTELISQTGKTYEELNGMTEKEISLLLGVGEAAAKAYKDVVDKINEETKNKTMSILLSTTELMNKYATLEEQIASVESKRDRDKENWTTSATQAGLSDEKVQAGVIAIDKNATEQIDQLREKSLELNDIWRVIFSDVADMGYQNLVEITAQAEELIKTAEPLADGRYKITLGTNSAGEKETREISGDQYARLNKQTAKLKREIRRDNPYKALKSALKDYQNAEKTFESNGFTSSVQQRRAAVARMGTAVKDLCGITKEVSGAWADAFSAMGNDSLGDTVSLVGDLAGEMGDMAAGMASGNMLQAGVAAAKSVAKVISTIAAAHDKKLEKQIKDSQHEVKVLTNLYKQLAWEVERAFGDAKNSLQAKQLVNLQRQILEIEYQIQKEKQKKKTDKDALADMEENLAEAKRSIQDIFDTMRDDIFGTVEDIANQLTDALITAFSEGKNAAEAWGDTVNDIIKNIVKNLFITQYLMPEIDKLIEKYMPSLKKGSQAEIEAATEKAAYYEKWLKDNQKLENSKKASDRSYYKTMKAQYEYWSKLAQSLNEINWSNVGALDGLGDDLNNLGTDAQGLFEWLDGLFGGLFGKDSKLEGLSKSIQTVTEDTANLLGAYINAIRADVSVKREYMRILVEGILPNLSNAIAEQLLYLKRIEANTARSANASEEVYSLLNAVTLGTKKLRVA